MKKVIIFLCVVVTALIFVAAFPSRLKKNEVKIVTKATGCGYRIIEFGVGVDCNGDTVKLSKAKGFQQLVSTKKVSGAGV